MSGIMPMVNVPDMVQYGRVTAHLVAFIADTLDDDDQIPDEIPLEGVVVLTPTVGVVRFPTTMPPRTAVVQALRCPIIGGDLYPPDTPLEGPLPDTPGVVVVASSQPVGLPDTVQWTATFELVGARVQPSSVTFEVPSGGVVDLTTVMPATPTPGTVVVVSTADRERAETAAATATQKASAAASSATAAATSATNAATSASAAASSATAAASSATAAQTAAAALQDTGWRNIASLLDPAKWEPESSGGYLRMKRTGTRVTVAGRIRSVSTIAYTVFTLPAGFSFANSYTTIGVANTKLVNTFYALGSFSNSIFLEINTRDLPAGVSIWFEVSWETRQAFPLPAAYPGTPA